MFVRWMTETVAQATGAIAIDGKTIRRAIRRSESSSFVHIVSAFGSANGLVYAQVKTDEKSNEIRAIPKLLDALSLAGCIITIDAIGCQTEIARKVVERGAHYLIGLKANQKTLLDDVDVAFDELDRNCAGGDVSSYETEEVSHGRGEWRRAEVLACDGHLTKTSKWPSLKSLVRITRERRGVKNAKATEDVSYFISSIAGLTGQRALALVRGHWSIENRLHWVLDVALREDDCRVHV